MSWRFRRREGRLAQRDADRLDALLSAAPTVADPADAALFRPEVAAAQAVAESITPVAEPPHAARVALRAGLAAQRVRSRRPVARAAFALGSMAAAGATALIAVLSSGATPGNTQVAMAQQSIDHLNISVKDLEAAVASGDPTVIHERAATAEAAAQQAQSSVAALPPPVRALALSVTNQRVQEIQTLINTAPVTQNSVAPARTPSSSTTTTAVPATTSSVPHRSTTTTPNSSTTSSSTTSTTTPRTTSTTEAPTTTTAAPGTSTTSAAPTESAGRPGR